jgi:hypothetical protein
MHDNYLSHLILINTSYHYKTKLYQYNRLLTRLSRGQTRTNERGQWPLKHP